MSDIATTQVFSNGETGITATKMNNIIGQASIQTSFVSGQPLASSIGTTDQFLLLTSGGTYARVPNSTLVTSVSGSLTPAGVGQAGIVNALSGNSTDYIGGDNACHNLVTAVTPTINSTIQSTRLRSFNSIGNPGFEVDQRTVAAGTTIGTGGFSQDRWTALRGGTTTAGASIKQTDSSSSPILVPGTNFAISSKFSRVTLTTAQATMAAADYVFINQPVEGIALRELIGDVHSVSLLVRSSVAGLSFGLALRDAVTVTRSLTKLCTIPTANTWTLITLPNLPVWASGGNFSIAPGAAGYTLSITLAAGSTYTSPANDTWQNGNFLGAVGQSNFAAQAVNSTFDVAFVQHEPGSQCTTLIDKPFTQAYDECLRYFYKTYDYGTAIGTVTNVGARTFICPVATTTAFGPFQYPKPMAKDPTVTFYNQGSGAANSVRDGGSIDHTGAAASASGQNGFFWLSFTTATGGAMQVYAHFIADTGW